MGVCASAPETLDAPSAKNVLRMGFLSKRATSADKLENVGDQGLAKKWNERFFVLQAGSLMYMHSTPKDLEATKVAASHLSAVDALPATKSCSLKHVKITPDTTVSVLTAAETAEWGTANAHVFEVSSNHASESGARFRFILCAENEWVMRAWIASITACAFATRQGSVVSAGAIVPHRALPPAAFEKFKADLKDELPSCEGELGRIAARLGAPADASGGAATKGGTGGDDGDDAGKATKPTKPRRLSSSEASRRFSFLTDTFTDSSHPSVNLSLDSIWAHVLPDSTHAEAFTPRRAVELLHRFRRCPLRFTVFADCMLRLAVEDRDFGIHTEAFCFYLPQIIHLADLPHLTQRLEDVLVALAAQSIQIALKIVWNLWGNHEDAMGHFKELKKREGIVHPAQKREHDWPHYFARSERLLLRIRNVVRSYEIRAPGARDMPLDVSVVEANLSEPLADLAPFQAIVDEIAATEEGADSHAMEHGENRLFAAWVLAHTDSAGRAAIWAAGLIPAAAGDDGHGLADIDPAWAELVDASAPLDPTRPLSKEVEKEVKSLALATFADAKEDASAADASASASGDVQTAFGSQLRFWYEVCNIAETLRMDINEETVKEQGGPAGKGEVKSRRSVLMPKLRDKLVIEPLGTCFYPVTPTCGRDDPLEEVARVSPQGRVFSTNERCPVLLYFETLVSTEREEVAEEGGATAGAATKEEGGGASAAAAIVSAAPTASASAAPTASAAAADVVVDVSEPVTRCRDPKIMGLPWCDEVNKVQAASSTAPGAVGAMKGWRLRSLLAKSNDDLRQEVFVMQLWSCMSTIMAEMAATDAPKLPLKCYQIISTGSKTGLIETLIEATSLDGLIDNHGSHNLVEHFNTQYMHEPAMLKRALNNFVLSLAAQSVATYMLQVKDRHNGNVMISSDGSIFNIDFGFLLGISTGFFVGSTRLAMEEVRSSRCCLLLLLLLLLLLQMNAVSLDPPSCTHRASRITAFTALSPLPTHRSRHSS